MERDVNGMIVCPHNQECRCKNAECHKCGWNPKVEKARKIENEKVYCVHPKLYKIPYTGFCEVYAHSEEEALEKANREDMFYASYDFGEPECLVKEAEDELD